MCCYLQICPTLFKLCDILWHYHAISLPGFASPVTASLALSCLVPCHAFGQPWSASTLANALLTTAQIRFNSFLPLYLTHSSCPVEAIPSHCRADLPWHFPDLSWFCLSLGCIGPALTLLTLLFSHCSSVTPKSSLDCVRVVTWLSTF